MPWWLVTALFGGCGYSLLKDFMKVFKNPTKEKISSLQCRVNSLYSAMKEAKTQLDHRRDIHFKYIRWFAIMATVANNLDPPNGDKTKHQGMIDLAREIEGELKEMKDELHIMDSLHK